jgi:hypothetical protein
MFPAHHVCVLNVMYTPGTLKSQLQGAGPQTPLWSGKWVDVAISECKPAYAAKICNRFSRPSIWSLVDGRCSMPTWDLTGGFEWGDACSCFNLVLTCQERRRSVCEQPVLISEPRAMRILPVCFPK